MAKAVHAQVVADAAGAEEGGDPTPAAALGPGEAGDVAAQEQLDGFKAYAMKAIWVRPGMGPLQGGRGRAGAQEEAAEGTWVGIRGGQEALRRLVWLAIWVQEEGQAAAALSPGRRQEEEGVCWHKAKRWAGESARRRPQPQCLCNLAAPREL
jgi:hypothetical protein